MSSKAPYRMVALMNARPTTFRTHGPSWTLAQGLLALDLDLELPGLVGAKVLHAAVLVGLWVGVVGGYVELARHLGQRRGCQDCESGEENAVVCVGNGLDKALASALMAYSLDASVESLLCLTTAGKPDSQTKAVVLVEAVAVCVKFSSSGDLAALIEQD
ncbi:hypothetical protein E4U19_005463 [Claviceps sp. Clav32 group G5]|nr:hypothetical protein E4U19_005463 [Claviceps sp. Clav32 group G5]